MTSRFVTKEHESEASVLKVKEKVLIVLEECEEGKRKVSLLSLKTVFYWKILY